MICFLCALIVICLCLIYVFVFGLNGFCVISDCAWVLVIWLLFVGCLCLNWGWVGLNADVS